MPGPGGLNLSYSISGSCRAEECEVVCLAQPTAASFCDGPISAEAYVEKDLVMTNTPRPTAILCLAIAAGLSSISLTAIARADDAAADSRQILTLDDWLKTQEPDSNEAPADSSPAKTRPQPPEPEAQEVVTRAAHAESSKAAAPIRHIEFHAKPATPVQTSQPAQPAVVMTSTQQLLEEARVAIREGDVRSAHLLAEAAAEMTIPSELFAKNAVRVLDEIDFVTSRRPAIVTTAFAQDAPADPAQGAPTSPPYTETKPGQNGEMVDETAASRPFRALGQKSLSIQPLRIDADGNRQALPERRAAQRFSREGEVSHSMGFSRDWTAISYAWEAPVARHQPLYFEDVELERYGNEVPIIQPALSAAHFYGSFASIPYQASLPDNAWFHCVYDLGYNRPGNCSPYSIHAMPLDATAGLSASGVFTGLVFMLMTP